MLAIRTLLLTQLAGALVAEAQKRDPDHDEQCLITVDAYSGHDDDAKHFDPFATGAVDAIVKEALEYDAVHLFAGGNQEDGYGPWVYVIFGNGNGDLDMISDYSVELESVVAPLNELSRGIEDGSVKLTIAA
jgi:hypothetical protein